MTFSWGRFDTRTLVLIPIAIAINIVLGQTVAAVLKVPVYLDSIGTVLVAVLAGPIPGLVTGVVTNLLWTYVLPAPFHSDYAAPFAVVAAWIGFFAGVVAQYGAFRSRPNTPWGKLAIGAVIVIVVLGAIGFYGVPSRVRDVIGEMRAPLLLLVAGADFTPLAEFEQFDQELTGAGVPHKMVVYDGAPHSFFDRTFAEHKAACDDAWRQILDFVRAPA